MSEMQDNDLEDEEDEEFGAVKLVFNASMVSDVQAGDVGNAINLQHSQSWIANPAHRTEMVEVIRKVKNTYEQRRE